MQPAKQLARQKKSRQSYMKRGGAKIHFTNTALWHRGEETPPEHSPQTWCSLQATPEPPAAACSAGLLPPGTPWACCRDAPWSLQDHQQGARCSHCNGLCPPYQLLQCCPVVLATSSLSLMAVLYHLNSLSISLSSIK